MSKLNRKNVILSGLVIGLLLNSFLQFALLGFDHQNKRNDNLKIKTHALDEPWIISFDCFGMEIAIDLNNCIYILAAENYIPDYGIPGPEYYGALIILKYNSTGDQLWRVEIEGLRLESSEIAVDSNSNLYLASMYENRSVHPNMLLFKFNSSGDSKWQKTWDVGHGYLVDIDIDSEDDIYIYGTSDVAEAHKYDLFIAKYNSSGDQQWFRLYGETEGDYDARDMEIDSNGNLIVSGYYYLWGPSYINFNWIRCYNQSGDLKWEVVPEQGSYYTLVVDSMDNVIVRQGAYIAKYDNLGNLTWTWAHQIEYYWIIKLALDSSDNIYLGTSINIPEDHYTYDLYVAKVNSSGSFEWYLTWGGPYDENLNAIDIDSNNNLYLLTFQLLIKNPEHNGKSLINISLWNFYMILFGICFFLALTSVLIIIKRKGR